MKSMPLLIIAQAGLPQSPQTRDARLMVLGLALILAVLIGLIVLVSIRWGSRRMLRPSHRSPAGASGPPVNAWEEAARRVTVTPTPRGPRTPRPSPGATSFEPFEPELALDDEDDDDLDDTEDDFGSSGGTTGFDFDGDGEDDPPGGRPRA